MQCMLSSVYRKALTLKIYVCCCSYSTELMHHIVNHLTSSRLYLIFHLTLIFVVWCGLVWCGEIKERRMMEMEMEMYLTFPNIILHFGLMWVWCGSASWIMDMVWIDQFTESIHMYRKVLAVVLANYLLCAWRVV